MALFLAVAGTLYAQTPAPEWRSVGTTVVDTGLAGTAGGAVDRVWFSPEGVELYARLANGGTFVTSDFEHWRAANAEPPAPSQFRIQPGLIQFRGRSILGGSPTDLLVSPRDPDEIVIANKAGVWRSLDGGQSWAGLNEDLPNLPALGILEAGRRTRVVLAGEVVAEWLPGAKSGWIPTSIPVPHPERSLDAGTPLAVAVFSGDGVYAGSADGRLWASIDQGRTWRPPFKAGDSGVPAIATVPGEPRIAIAAVGRRVYRTMNGGLFWDDMTANFPVTRIMGVSADLSTGAIYVATRNGLFYTYADLRAAAPSADWQRITGLPDAALLDVKLDAEGNQLFVLLEGRGVMATLAPHRFREPKAVNALDRTSRAAAPGSLLSIIGTRSTSVTSGGLEFPILAATERETQLQVPFSVSGSTLQLSATDARALRRQFEVPLRAASPAIFVDQDGTPILLDADRGVLVESGTALEAGSRIQVLATGLGRVTPDWPTGLPAPAENPPKVAEAVRAYVDRQAVRVIRAALAPGYVGLYIVEIELPAVVNAGPAELYLEAAGQQSERVSVQLVQ
jgi:uncharacterized protein (TIGR03437 family)